MLCKYYEINRESEEYFRETKYFTGTRDEIDQKLFPLRMSDRLGGYHIYDYESKEQFLKDPSYKWKKHLIHEWFDRDALVSSYRPFHAFPSK